MAFPVFWYPFLYKVKVGFLQFAPEFKSPDKNLARIERLISPVEADGLVLPELSTTGYAFNSKEELLPFAEPIPGPTTERLTRFATAKGIWLVVGLAERDGDDIYNSSILISKDGKLHKYRKIHLFDREKLIFSPGNLPFQVIDIVEAGLNPAPTRVCTVKIGLLICFDWIFPEAVRTLALKGAQIICHSANLVLPYCQPAMQTRAIENRVFIITANRTGEERSLKFTGNSQVVNPKGEVLLKADAEEECVKVIEIDPAQALDKNVTEYNNVITDRRPEFYL